MTLMHKIASPGVFVQETGIDEVEIVLPYGCTAEIRKYLFSDTSREYICQLLCGHTLIGRRLRLLVCYLVQPEPEDYLSQSLTSLRLNPEYDLQLRNACKQERLSLVDVHSHPFAQHHGAFSSLDDRDEWDQYGYFRRNLPECLYGSIVMGRASQEGRLFLHQEGSPSPRAAPMRIVCRDTPLTGGEESDARLAEAPRFDRQVRAFGKEGQRNLSTLKVGIVGVGGLGASLAIGLTRLGVRSFVLVDPDRVEETNLHRLAGTRASDARRRISKVRMVARRMAQIDSTVIVDPCAHDVFAPTAWQRLRDADIIVAATDNHASCMLLNALAHQYLVPLVSVGTLIRTHGGHFVDGYGELYSVLPGQPEPCLLCSQVLNKTEAYYELGPENNRRQAVAQGYIEGFDEPDPAVYHLNGVMVNLALLEIHNLACGFMPRKVHLHYTMSERWLLTIEDPPQKCAVCSPNGANFARGDQVDPLVHLFGGVSFPDRTNGAPSTRRGGKRS